MELTDKIYPQILSAPPLTMEDEGQNFRLSKISEIRNFLEKEVKEREGLTKKYLKISTITDNVEAGLTTLALGAGAGGIALLSTIAAIPASLALEAVALAVGLSAIVSKFVVRKTRTKAEKHLMIRVLADSKLNTVNNHISKAIEDNKISHEEFKLILEESEKYKKIKEEIRDRSKKKSATEEKASLIEKGKQEARKEFRRLVERRSAGS